MSLARWAAMAGVLATLMMMIVILVPWRVLSMAIQYHRARVRHPEWFDGSALAAVMASLEQDGY